jgi:large subunit ribosomal protein L18
MKSQAQIRLQSRITRHKRIRRKVSGTSEVPRLCISRSNKEMYAQIIDDTQGKSLVQLSTRKVEGKTKVEKSLALGKLLARSAQDKGVTNVVFDRGGYLFHGRVKAIADGAREGGLKF